MEYTPIERRMEMIRILYNSDTYTIKNLAFRLGVSTRTIRRDITAISIRIPIITQQGKYGGVSVKKDQKLDRLYMAKNECLLLQKLLSLSLNKEKCLLTTEEIQTLKELISFYSPILTKY